MTPEPQEGPLDGSTSGTIGGGGADTGGPTIHPKPPEMPPVRAENAASGRLEPEPLAEAKDNPEE
jgi:hypothetical protein